MAPFEKPKFLDTFQRSAKELLGIYDPSARKQEIDAVRRQEENDRYDDAILRGEFDFKTVLQKFHLRFEDMKKDSKANAYISADLIEPVHRKVKESLRNKIRKGEIPAVVEAELDKKRAVNDVELFVLINGQKPNLKSKPYQDFGAEIQTVAPMYLTLQRDKQKQVAQNLKDTFHFSGDTEILRKALLVHSKKSADIHMLQAVTKDEKAFHSYVHNVEHGIEPSRALRESIQHGSEALQKSFEYYSHQADAFKDSLQELDIPLEKPSEKVVASTVQAYQTAHFHLDIAPGGNSGFVYGSGFLREAAVYLVDGKPCLFVYDSNSDKGVRGPIYPQESQKAFFEITADEYFSERFRHYASPGAETDPLKVADKKLFTLIYAFLKKKNDASFELNISSKNLLDNLARILVDGPATIPQKMEYFDIFLKQPEKITKAQILLCLPQWKGFQKSFDDFKKLIDLPLEQIQQMAA